MFSKDNENELKSTDQLFEGRGSALCIILKICFVCLRALSHAEKIIDDSKTNYNISNDMRLSELKISTFPASVVHMLWSELLELEGCSKQKEAIRFWKKFVSSDVRENFFQQVHNYFETNLYYKFLGSEEILSSFKKKTLQFIQDSLVNIGVIEIQSYDSLGHTSVQYLSSQDRKCIVFDFYQCHDYGIYLFENNKELKPQKQSTLRTFSNLVTVSCLKIFTGQREATASETDYTLQNLPFHLLEAGRIEEALNLLCSSLFFRRRVTFYNICIASKMHGKDCLNLQYFLEFNEREDVKKTVISCYFKLIDFVEEFHSKVNAEECEFALSRNALILEDMNWKKEAVIFYEKALVYQKANPSLDLACTMIRLGDIYTGPGLLNYKRSIKYYTEALFLQKKLLGETHELIAKTCEKLYRVYVLKEDYDMAFIYCEELISTKITLYGPESLEVALVKKDFGDIYYVTKCYENALKNYKEAYNTALAYKKDNASLVAALSYIMGNIYYLTGDYESAVKYYNKTLSFRQTFDGKSHQSITGVLEAKGNSFLHMKDINSSISCYKNALLIAKSFHTDNVPQIQKKLALVFQQNGEYEEAIKLYKDILHSFTVKDIVKDENVAEIVFFKAECHEKNNDIPNAIIAYIKLLEIPNVDDYHMRAAINLQEIGDRCVSDSSIDQAISCFMQAKKIQSKIGADNDNAVADLQQRLGSAFIKKGQLTQARDCLLDALRIRRIKFGDVHECVADILHARGIVEKLEKNYEAASELFHEALEIRRKVFGDFHLKIAESMHILGVIMTKMENYSGASCYLEDALKAYQKSGMSENDFHVQDIRKCMNYLNEKEDISKKNILVS